VAKVSEHVLLQFAPLIYVAWADGELTRDEITRIHDQLERVKSAGAETAAVAARWLNPDRPPSASDLQELLKLMRKAAKARSRKNGSRASLLKLGRELAGQKDAEELPSELAALAEVERALALDGTDALHAILGRDEPAGVEQRVTFSSIELNRFLDGERAATRRQLFEIMRNPAFQIDPRLSTPAYRERVLAAVHLLADQGIGATAFPPELGGNGAVARSITAFETLAFGDLSVLVKYGVHFGLFCGSIYQLGTTFHHEEFLPAVMRLELPGCFAMTESGHGSNVREIETTATYDPVSQEFVIHTPRPEARKDYIGNAAQHGRMATVFAQLRIGDEEHGVHAFLVPIRNEKLEALPGVMLEDCGEKTGLHGVDNGRIRFDHVRIPRTNLLNRFADVSEDGTYSSVIANPGRRFFTMLGTLVAGRISIGCASVSVSKTALTIALRYTAQRRQFGPSAAAEVPVLSYLTMQRSLLPHLALTIALDAALEQLVQRFAAGADLREVETDAAGLKAFASTHNLNTLQAAREACGGAGFMQVMRVGQLRADADIFTTFEGANPVLLQLVAKALLGGLREQFGEMRFIGFARYLGARASTAVAELNPLITRKSDPEHLRDPEFHTSALRYREHRLLTTAARRMKSRIDHGTDSFDALNEVQDHVVALAQAHVERSIIEAFDRKLAQCGDPTLLAVLRPLRALAGLHLLERDRAWFLEAGYFEPAKAKALREEVNRLCQELAPHAVSIVDSFGIPDFLA